MHIRQYQADDHEAVLGLHYAGLDEHRVNKGLGPWDDDLRDIVAAYQESGGLFLVAYHNDQLIAMGALARLDHETGEIKRMRVDSSHRRKGYGQQVLNALVQFAAENGLRRLVLDTTDRQHAAQGLYIKNGFIESRRESDDNAVNIYFSRELPNKALERTPYRAPLSF